MHPLQETAYLWHGGQWSALYSFASTGGVVHSNEHRDNLLREINGCLHFAAGDDHKALEALHAHIKGAMIGAKLGG